MAIGQLFVGLSDHVLNPTELLIELVLIEPPAEESLDGSFVWVELDEVEPAAQREVHEGDGAVRGVHGADDVEVGRQGEGLVGVLEAHLLVPVLQKEIELAEDLGEVATVDLGNDEEVFLV